MGLLSLKEARNNPIVSLKIFHLEFSFTFVPGMPLIDKFHTDPKIFIFLISTLAGGTGLNLTGNLHSYEPEAISEILQCCSPAVISRRCQQGCHLW